MSSWARRLEELAPTIELLAERMNEEGRHVLRGHLSLIGLMALLEPEDLRLVTLSLKVLVLGMPEPED